MKIAKNSNLLFIGDSITDCGRERPVGRSYGLGNGYVKIIHGLISAVYPDYKIKTTNMGIGGNTVLDLKKRWNDDVFAMQPDWLVIMIGINDVWRHFDAYFENIDNVSIEEYADTLDFLLLSSQETISNIVVMSPYFIELNGEDPMRKMMNQYNSAAKETAKKHNKLYVDVQKAFDEAMQCIPNSSLARDRVHPEATGHTIIAKAFLDAVGFDFNRNKDYACKNK